MEWPSDKDGEELEKQEESDTTEKEEFVDLRDVLGIDFQAVFEAKKTI